jgi:hypothetical protein
LNLTNLDILNNLRLWEISEFYKIDSIKLWSNITKHNPSSKPIKLLLKGSNNKELATIVN